jgi:hypothetical protein
MHLFLSVDQLLNDIKEMPPIFADLVLPRLQFAGAV